MPLDGTSDAPEPETLTGDDPEAERAIRCARCDEAVTVQKAGVEVAGRHHHTFMNPSASVFHIRCFAEAEGCTSRGSPSSDYSWFSGHLWSYAHCRTCGWHLGWSFHAEEAPALVAFFGLMEDRLVDEEGG